MADNANIARGLYEAWNNRDFDYFNDFVTDDTELVNVGTGTVLKGREGVHYYNKAWADAFPDGKATVDRVLESGNTVVVEYTGRGTHTGPLVSEMGTIPATGKSVTITFCDVSDFENGKLKRQRTYFDSGAMMAQLGLTEMPASTTR